MEDFLSSWARGSAFAQIAYDKLRDRLEIMNVTERPLSHAMRIPINRPDDRVTHLSIAFPPDCLCAETALFKNDELIYIDEFGYGDIRRGFGSGDPNDSSTIDSLIEEIRRLETENPGNPNYETDSDDEENEENEENNDQTYSRESPMHFCPFDRPVPARVSQEELDEIINSGNMTSHTHEMGVLVKDHDNQVEYLFMNFSPGHQYEGFYDVGY